MKPIFILFLLIFSFSEANSQVQDDFSDGNFTDNPTWTGDDAKFEVNTAQQLHLNAPAVTDTAYLSIASSLIDNIEWDLYFKMDFSPSASNYLKVYLVTDQSDLKKSLNGYYLKIGEDGSNDAIDLYLQQGDTETLIIAGIPGNVAASVNTVSIKVKRDNAGNWEVYSDITGGTSYILEGSGFDNTITSASFFGFFCKYTGSRSTAFYFDNIYIGPPIVDIDPPQLSQLSVISSNQVDVCYNETINPLSAEDELNYSCDNGIGNPTNAVVDTSNQKLVHLAFSSSFQNGITNTLSVKDVSDLSGNTMTTASASFVFYSAQKNDIVINEIMADPDPVVGLPEAEFVELYNQSAFPIDLAGWTFGDATATQTIPPFLLLPGSYLILCDDANKSLFTAFGDVIGFSSFPSLNNDGDDLILRNAAGIIVNSVSYATTWYQDELKSPGGWTLEMIDPGSQCQGINNWIASNNAAGGTPGKKNSVFGNNPDGVPPQLLQAKIISSKIIQLVFNESLDSAISTGVSHYTIEPSLPIKSVSVMGPDFTTVELMLYSQIDSNTAYTITVSGISDCSGNTMDSDNSVQFANPAVISNGDIIINEILFNPQAGGYHYVELYNNSNKIFDLKNLKTATVENDDSITGINDLCADTYLFFPQQYVVITENAEWVRQHYSTQNPDWFIETGLPSLNDDEGVIVLVNSTGEEIDRLHYSASWQFPLINDAEQVALERVSINSPTQDSMNWHSAAATVGFGTPSYRNSQFTQPDVVNEITLSPQVFSPDQDGFNDLLSISYQFGQPGFIANVNIYDASGRQVAELIHNGLLAQTGTLTWDGVIVSNVKAPIGLYIIYTEIFDLEGKVKHYKNVFAIGGKKT